MVTDYDCWHPGHEAVTVDQVIAVLTQNASNACEVVRRAVASMPKTRGCKCGSALKHAIQTQPDVIPAAARKKYALLLGKYLAPQKKKKAKR